jgi:hypothetical protein
MTGRIIVGIVAVAFVAAFGIWGTFVNLEIVDRVNSRLPPEERFAAMGWHYFKVRRLHRRYLEFYPDGRLLLRERILRAMMFVCLIIAAWSLQIGT